MRKIICGFVFLLLFLISFPVRAELHGIANLVTAHMVGYNAGTPGVEKQFPEIVRLLGLNKEGKLAHPCTGLNVNLPEGGRFGNMIISMAHCLPETFQNYDHPKFKAKIEKTLIVSGVHTIESYPKEVKYLSQDEKEWPSKDLAVICLSKRLPGGIALSQLSETMPKRGTRLISAGHGDIRDLPAENSPKHYRMTRLPVDFTVIGSWAEFQKTHADSQVYDWLKDTKGGNHFITDIPVSENAEGVRTQHQPLLGDSGAPTFEVRSGRRHYYGLLDGSTQQNVVHTSFAGNLDWIRGQCQ